MNIVIRELEVTDKESFLQALPNWDNSPGFIFFPHYTTSLNFNEYVQMLKDFKNGVNLKPNYVPDTCHFAFKGNEIVGRVSIRHSLNEFLLKIGGHIGYGVFPSHRRKGVATSLLKHALKEANSLGINNVLVTCDDNNFGSIKVIEKCHGRLENKIENGNSQILKRRYWIEN